MFKRKRRLRGAPRIRLDDGERTNIKNIRFTSSKYSNVLTSSIYDISETGIAFTCSRKLAPNINELIKIEITPFSSVHIACLGRVVRIESPTPQSNWNRFPDTVKIGVSYYQMPFSYRRLMSESMQDAFAIRNIKPQFEDPLPPMAYRQYGNWFDWGWLEENWMSLLITLALLTGTIYAGLYLMDNIDSRKPASAPGWSKNFFEKIKTR